MPFMREGHSRRCDAEDKGADIYHRKILDTPRGLHTALSVASLVRLDANWWQQTQARVTSKHEGLYLAVTASIPFFQSPFSRIKILLSATIQALLSQKKLDPGQ